MGDKLTNLAQIEKEREKNIKMVKSDKNYGRYKMESQHINSVFYYRRNLNK